MVKFQISYKIREKISRDSFSQKLESQSIIRAKTLQLFNFGNYIWGNQSISRT